MMIVEIVQYLSVAIQLAVAIYALWLNQVFGTHRAGWSLCVAFLLMALLYSSRAYTAPGGIEEITSLLPPGLGPELIYLFISLLLFVGMSHVHSVFRERRRTEDALIRSQQTLEERVRERTIALVQANEDLRNEIGERKLMEAQLLRAQKIEALGDLAAGVAQDFNEILLVIECYAQLLIGRVADDREATQQLNHLLVAAQKASTLTRQLLSFTNKDQMKPRVLQLHHLLLNYTSRLQYILGDEINVVVETGDRPPLAYVDSDLLEQALNCLASNSREAMPKGGEFTVGAAIASIDQTYCASNRQARPGEFVCLTVRDTGKGMTPETMGHLFEPFFTTKEQGKGAGLGLATVYGIVRMHKGWIDVSSEPKKGTTFKLYLPGAAQALEGAKKSAPAKGGGLRGDETVLVVDADETVRRAAKAYLQEFGYSVLEATSPAGALSVLEGNHTPINLLIMDSGSQGKEDGRQFASQFKMLKPGLAVILTAASFGDVVGNALDSEDHDQVLVKPFAKEALAKMARDRLDRVAAGKTDWLNAPETASPARTAPSMADVANITTPAPAPEAKSGLPDSNKFVRRPASNS